MNIFIIHHIPLKERKEYITKKFSEMDIEINWIENFLPEEITQEDKDRVNVDTKDWPREHWPAGRGMTIGQLSNFLKHEYCINLQCQNKYDVMFVFEDDVNLDNINIPIKKYIEDVYNEFKSTNLDICVVATHDNKKANIMYPERIIQPVFNEYTRCIHAILFKLNAAKIIKENLKEINFNFDFQLNQIIKNKKLTIGWAEPGLTQLTNDGLWESSNSSEIYPDEFLPKEAK
jgi:hypothetical protein